MRFSLICTFQPALRPCEAFYRTGGCGSLRFAIELGLQKVLHDSIVWISTDKSASVQVSRKPAGLARWHVPWAFFRTDPAYASLTGQNSRAAIVWLDVAENHRLRSFGTDRGGDSIGIIMQLEALTRSLQR
jgi:hypothetical protein